MPLLIKVDEPAGPNMKPPPIPSPTMYAIPSGLNMVPPIISSRAAPLAVSVANLLPCDKAPELRKRFATQKAAMPNLRRLMLLMSRAQVHSVKSHRFRGFHTHRFVWL